MTLNHLLLWLSAKGAGSWSQFRAAVEELHAQRDISGLDDASTSNSGSDLPLYHEVRFALQRLGHVEFPSGEAEHAWRVVPPSLAFMPGTDTRALLCGGRSAALLDRLTTVANVEVLSVDGMPDRVVLSGASTNDIGTRARALGLQVQQSAPIALLSAIPGVRDPATWHDAEVPRTPGWVIHQFSPSRLQWTPISQAGATRATTGLFRFVLKHQRFYYLQRRGRSYSVPVQVGKYAIMSKRHAALTYESARKILSFPVICRPPLLIERALVLCSGVLPYFEPQSGRIEYGEVYTDVARLAAELLCQEVR